MTIMEVCKDLIGLTVAWYVRSGIRLNDWTSAFVQSVSWNHCNLILNVLSELDRIISKIVTRIIGWLNSHFRPQWRSAPISQRGWFVCSWLHHPLWSSTEFVWRWLYCWSYVLHMIQMLARNSCFKFIFVFDPCWFIQSYHTIIHDVSLYFIQNDVQGEILTDKESKGSHTTCIARLWAVLATGCRPSWRPPKMRKALMQ